MERRNSCQKVVDANGVPMLTSSGGSEIVIEMLQSAGASPMVDGKVNLVDNAALKAAINVYKELIEKGIMVDYTDWDQYIASMNDGKAAGVIQGCWIMSSIQAAEDQSGKWAIVNMPKLDDISGARSINSDHVVSLKSSTVRPAFSTISERIAIIVAPLSNGTP